jgi:hypothetical protein
MSILEILAIFAAAVLLIIAGVVLHAWMSKQKTSPLRTDAIKAAVDVLITAANSTEEDEVILAATERKQALALAVTQATSRLSSALAAKSTTGS